MTVKRYETKAPCCYCHGGGCGDCRGPDEHPDGELVLYDDYAALLPLARFASAILRGDGIVPGLKELAKQHGLIEAFTDSVGFVRHRETAAAKVLDEEATK